MGTLEIVLLVIGAAAFVLGYVLPAGKRTEEELPQFSEEQIKEIVNKEVDQAKSQIGDIVDETITYAMEKTERSMDRLTNEKIMAVNEYSDTVLGEINKNHKEVVFLYDMLNDKHENLKETVTKADQTAKEVKQTAKEAEYTAKQVEQTAKQVEQTVKEAETAVGTVQAEPAESPVQVEPVDFQPIHAKQVEVLIQPEETEVKAPESKPAKKTAKPKTTAKKAEAGEVDLHFTTNQAPTGGRNSNEHILELHKAGKSNMAIAKELGLGIGEVKLVIDLFEGV